ncbi:MAG: RNA-binding protein [Armatimonadetes bacterium]|nr:RNA-binding protein [Armatimonadota bacterium]
MNLYVGNLPFSIDDKQLLEMFEKFGAVESARVIRDRDTDVARGFGFVEMVREDDAQEAIDKLNGREVGGRQLVVNQARARSRR